jgi:tetratricopeptide (TPR) repeat protein
VGINRAWALGRFADAQIDLWDDAWEEQQQPEAAKLDSEPLALAAGAYLEYLCRCPASWRPLAGLGRIYGRADHLRLLQQAAQQEQPPLNSWADVGLAGRLSIGLHRMAIERAPNWYANYDRLALTLGGYGLIDEALATVKRSAQVMPLFFRHKYERLAQMPPGLLDAFAEGARSVLGKTPFLTQMDQLMSLATVESMRGNPKGAVELLEQALNERGDALNRAEAHYRLGTALWQDRQYERARAELELAVEHPSFEAAALGNLALMARDMNQPEWALELLRRLRWKDPTNLDYCLQFADVARVLRDYPAAVQALRWASVSHPSEPRPQLALVETYIQMGDLLAANDLLNELQDAGHGGEELERLRRVLAGSGT